MGGFQQVENSARNCGYRLGNTHESTHLFLPMLFVTNLGERQVLRTKGTADRRLQGR